MNATITQGTIEHIDPRTLVIETNVRSMVELDNEFVESIRTVGVLTPILGYRDSDGTVHVRAGQRRTRAAQQVELATVPVYIVDAAQEGAERIIEQLIENEHREGLTEADRIAAWKQLEFEGMSLTQIAKRTGNKRARVKTGLAVAATETGTTLVADHGLTLDQAATLLEFADDPELVADLTKTAGEQPDYFPVAVERVRKDRAHRAVCAAAEEEEAAKGHRILEEQPSYDAAPYPLYSLTTSDGKQVKSADLQGKDGVAVFVSVNYDGDVVTRYYLDDPAAHGYTSSSIEYGAKRGPMTDEQKAERKTLIANNKEWDAAETVRREWLTNFIARKTLPKNATAVIASSLTHGSGLVAQSMERGSAIAKQLLGLDQVEGAGLSAYLDSHPTRALHVALAVTLGGIEQTTNRYTWRNPSKDTARYFNTLAEWGYPLCPVERIAAMLDPEEQ